MKSRVVIDNDRVSTAEISVPYANLYIWRDKRKDAPIHAIAASLFQNGAKVLEAATLAFAKRLIKKPSKGIAVEKNCLLERRPSESE
jgi:hypothetical protein